MSAPCPNCQYEIEFTFLQARLEEQVLCPCCKRPVQLVNLDASLDEALRDIESALSDLN